MTTARLAIRPHGHPGEESEQHREQHTVGAGEHLDTVGGDTITRSAATLGAFVERVRRETGARTVDMVGHSQGALVIDNTLTVPSRRHFWNSGTDGLTTATTNAVTQPQSAP